MKEIILKNNNLEIIVDSNLSYYLFSKLFIFFLEDDNLSGNYVLSENRINNLKDILEEYLIEILKKWYKEPTEKEIQKHSTRYERIKLSSTIYKVNYRMSEVGRLVFLIYNILKMLEESSITGEQLNLNFKEI
ncbi:MAG: hypothetical protein DI622_09890 [Chryseobacterium sp.]|uniref:hypothetical protein n=1 Tax=Chryseobacterium sp. TaxID=1871047 RepID=UPI000DB5312E|nr:hypothetical protein [Chryseobacterium sp.]MPS66513.1 hypothetical protein [Chryseobacterium sp.]PZU18545.1 MAG: hypothetical protein DI622_09890 [Chryseobacterium sp.]